jgi:hypothetical protein
MIIVPFAFTFLVHEYDASELARLSNARPEGEVARNRSVHSHSFGEKLTFITLLGGAYLLAVYTVASLLDFLFQRMRRGPGRITSRVEPPPDVSEQ